MASARLDLPALGTVLGVWAHPDDEAFLAAGLTARLTDAGVPVTVVTATRGEVGTDDPAWSPERLGRRRALEMRASMAVVGVTDHRWLGHVDGSLAEVGDEIGVAQVAAVVDEVRPDTVVTFGPEGMTGHPDHITVSRWATRAAEQADHPVRVLCATTSADFTRRWADLIASTGAFEGYATGLPLATPAEEVALEVVLDEDERDRKLTALTVQASQIAPLVTAIGEPTLRDWWGIETFTDRTPVRPTGRRSSGVGAGAHG